MNRIYHTWEKWECYPAGLYESRPANEMTSEQCEGAYSELLRDIPEFKNALTRVITEWPKSCEHYLSNENMNRIAWLGQASLCISKGIPGCFRGGFNKLTESEKSAADKAAFDCLNLWLTMRGEPEIATMEEAGSKTEMNLY